MLKVMRFRKFSLILVLVELSFAVIATILLAITKRNLSCDIEYGGCVASAWFALFKLIAYGIVVLTSLALAVLAIIRKFRHKGLIEKGLSKKAAWIILGLVITIYAAGLVLASVIIRRQLDTSSYPLDYPYSCEVPGSGVCTMIEDLGKVKVANRTEIKQLVKQHGRDKVTIRALEFEDIKDKAFLRQLLGDKYIELGCIILVSYPNGQYVYLEDEKLEVITRLDGTMFADWLKNASKDDLDYFYAHVH